MGIPFGECLGIKTAIQRLEATDPVDVKKRRAQIEHALKDDESRVKLQKLQAIYVPGLPADMVAAYNLFDYVAKQYKAAREADNRSIIVYYSNTDGRGFKVGPGEAWPGGDWTRAELERRNIPPEALRATESVTDPTQYKGLHTRGEADVLVERAKADGISSVLMVTTPWFRARSMTSLVTAMAMHGHAMDAYYANRPLAPGFTMDTEIVGSQGKRMRIQGASDFEDEQLAAYWGKGCHDDNFYDWINQYAVPADVVDEYLEARNAGKLDDWKQYMKKTWGVTL